MCSLKPKSNDGGQGMSCSNCQTTKTPLWRRSEMGELLCNACGLYAKSRNLPRPISKPTEGNLKKEICIGTCPGDGHCNGTGGSLACSGCPALNQQRHAPSGEMNLSCTNCSSTTTPLWRRDVKGSVICNACGLYFKMHGHHRPITMRKPTIKRRNRISSRESPRESAHEGVVTETSLDSPRPSCCSHGSCPATPDDIENYQPLTKHNDCLPKLTVAMNDGPLVPTRPKQYRLSHIINPPGSPNLNSLPILPPLLLNNQFTTSITLPSISSLNYFPFPTYPLLSNRLSDSIPNSISSYYTNSISPNFNSSFDVSSACKKSKTFHQNLPIQSQEHYIPTMSYLNTF